LLFLGGPSAIIGLVVSVIVDSIYRMRWAWALAHVGEKVLKGIQPTVTNSYASAAIITVVMVTLIKATPFHSGPRPIFNRVGHAVSLILNCMLIFLVAAAGL
jgi:hypothetical protein